MTCVTTTQAAAQPIEVGDRKQLMIDDRFIDQSHGVVLTVNPPVKTYDKLVVCDADRPWENTFVGPYCTVMKDDGLYRMWYESYYRLNDQPREGVLCYAESDDGLHWRKPMLGVHDFHGSTANNIVFPPPGEKYHGGTVFKDPSAPPSERYKLIHYPGDPGVCGAVSPDGLRWRSLDENPLMRHQSDTQNVCFRDEQRGRYVAYVRLNMPVRDSNRIRTIGRSETDDFRRWPAPDVVLSYDDLDPPDVDLYNTAAIKYPSAPDVYFAMPSCFHQRRDALEPQLATSRDGVQWFRPQRKPFLPLGEPGCFDSHMIHVSVGQFQVGDAWWLFYRGTDRSHTSHGHKSQVSGNGVISRAVSRLDGHVSLDAAEDGWFLTPPMTTSHKHLTFNYQTQPGGAIRVGVCRANGQWMAGCSIADSLALTGDHLAAPARWRNTPIAAATNEPLRLRLELRRAKMFGFRFTDMPTGPGMTR